MHTSVVLIIACLCIVNAHICLYDPKQRGPVDISKPSGTCFQPVGPCGKYGPEDPKVTLTVGEHFTFNFQQNLNHFSIGSPGYIDVALSKGVPPAGKPERDEDFDKVDGFVPDYFAHAEWKQTNMTYDMLVPEGSECDHCVVRFRYITHKPGEPIFHQCVDVKIVAKKQSTPKITLNHRIKSTKTQLTTSATSNIYGIYYDPSSMKTASFARINSAEPVVEVLTSLEQVVRTYKSPIDGHSRPLHFPQAINDGIVVFVPKERSLYYTITQSGDDLANVETLLMRVNVDTFKSEILAPLKLPVATLHYDEQHDVLIGVFVRDSPRKAKNYEYQVVLIDRKTGGLTSVTETEPDDYFIDFVWSEYDQRNQVLYILARNEHDPLNQTQKIIVVDIQAHSIRDVFGVDYKHSFSSMHLVNGSLYAITQGVPFEEPTPFKFELFRIVPEKRSTEFVFQIGTHNVQDWSGQVRQSGRGSLLYQIYRPPSSNKLAFYPIDVTNASYQPTVASCGKLAHVYNVIAI